jgi:hypothetical protein
LEQATKGVPKIAIPKNNFLDRLEVYNELYFIEDNVLF